MRVDKKRVVVLGGGAGGTLVANLLARKLKKRPVEITLIDKKGIHAYQPGYLYVAFGWEKPQRLNKQVTNLLSPRVNLVVDEATFIDTGSRRVSTARGTEYPYDVLVIATGSRVDPDAIPGLREASHHFYTEAGALALNKAIDEFPGGEVVIGVASVPYKCPPAPLEFAFMLEWELNRRGLREKTNIHFTSPLPRAFPIESVSEMVTPILAERNIELHTFFNLESVNLEERTIESLEGETLKYDLLVMVPPHKGAQVIIDSGLGDKGGWVPTDKETLKVKDHEGIFAIGDATDLPISKSGSAAHFEAETVVHNVIAELYQTGDLHRYTGKVMCFLETGYNQATLLNFDYRNPPVPPKQSALYHWEKMLFNKAYFHILPQGRLPG